MRLVKIIQSTKQYGFLGVDKNLKFKMENVKIEKTKLIRLSIDQDNLNIQDLRDLVESVKEFPGNTRVSVSVEKREIHNDTITIMQFTVKLVECEQ